MLSAIRSMVSCLPFLTPASLFSILFCTFQKKIFMLNNSLFLWCSWYSGVFHSDTYILWSALVVYSYSDNVNWTYFFSPDVPRFIFVFFQSHISWSPLVSLHILTMWIEHISSPQMFREKCKCDRSKVKYLIVIVWKIQRWQLYFFYQITETRLDVMLHQNVHELVLLRKRVLIKIEPNGTDSDYAVATLSVIGLYLCKRIWLLIFHCFLLCWYSLPC